VTPESDWRVAVALHEQVVTIAIYEALDELNNERPTENALEKSPDTRLIGRESGLDSLEFVRFIVAVEEQLVRRFGVPITLADERALSQRHSPFRSVRTLTQYVVTLIAEIPIGR
jgi:acyl carrier protein